MNIFRSILKSKGFPVEQAAAELGRIQKMSLDEFQQWQQKKAWDIVKFHYRYNDLYKNKVGKILPDKWDDLPVITKQDLQRPMPEVLSKTVNLKDCYVSNTSGSTGTPFFFAKDKFAHAMTWALIASRYKLWGIGSASRQARFYGIPKEFKSYWKEKIKDSAMGRTRFSVFDLSDRAMENFIKRFANNNFTYLYGYTNALVLFARYLIGRNIILNDVCPSLQLCISTSEVCTPEDHLLLEKGFGIKHIREYGVSETCLMAFDMPSGQWALTEETLYTEVAGDDDRTLPPGNEGNILTTSLFNTAYPMIRYRVGDMGEIVENKDSMYRNLVSLAGRTNDTVRLPDGRVAAGLTFYYISRSILESTGILKEFIIRQTTLSHFVFDIVSDRDLTDDEAQQIKDKMALYLSPGLGLTINRVDTIRRPASGKLKHFYSEL